MLGGGGDLVRVASRFGSFLLFVHHLDMATADLGAPSEAGNVALEVELGGAREGVKGGCAGVVGVFGFDFCDRGLGGRRKLEEGAKV